MSDCNKRNYFGSAILALILLACLGGCAPLGRPPAPPVPEQPAAIPPVLPEKPYIEESIDPRRKASLQLTDQARILLRQERYDDAIRTLERSLGLYPQNGQSFYYMAEAWLEKGNRAQAAEFNRLAEMYLDDPGWDARIETQRRAIESPAQ